MSDGKKTNQREIPVEEVLPFLKNLPGIRFVRRAPGSAVEGSDKDTIYGVKSLRQIGEAVDRLADRKSST